MSRRAETILAVAVLSCGLVCLAVGAFAGHKVYERDDAAFGFLAYTRVSDADLVVDSTFTGVVRERGRLYSTYDRTQPRGKQLCPT